MSEKDNEHWVKKYSRKAGKAMRLAATGAYEGVTGDDETPKPKKDSSTPDLSDALRRVAGGSENTGDDSGPENNGKGPWGKLIGAAITAGLTNYLTKNWDLGWIGRGTLTGITAAVGVWLGDMVSDWFSSLFNKKAKDDPNSPARKPVAQVDLPSVPGGTSNRNPVEPDTPGLAYN